MMGVPFRVDGQGRVLISWMSRNKAYWSISDPGATRFAPRSSTPDAGNEAEAYPLVLVHPRDEILLVWVQKKQVHWARYGLDGKFTGAQGQAGTLSSGGKPAGFVDTDGNFTLVF